MEYSPKSMSYFRTLLGYVKFFCPLLCFIAISYGCKESKDLFNLLGTLTTETNRNAKIRIATRNAPTSYYYDKDGKLAGFEYELAKSFVHDLGHEAEFVIYDTVEQILEAITSNEVDFAAAGLMKTPERNESFSFGPEYQTVAQLIVCQDSIYANDLSDLIGKSLVFTSKSAFEEHFMKAQRNYPALTLEPIPSLSSEQLLEKADNGEYDCVAVDETIFELNRHVFENLAVSFTLDRGPLAWPFSQSGDSLVDKANSWFADPFQRDFIAQLHEKYYGSFGKNDIYDMFVFKQRIETHLPEFTGIIQEAAEQTGLDFTFLAAVAYQESHWDPKNRSNTGVRGFMMLTLPTAKSLGVENRLDARQSMLAGAQYLKELIERFPSFITPENRRWLGLAAYNVGYYHVQDARHLAIDLQKNPNLWRDVKDILPLLSNKKYYKRTRYGYARGHEPTHYVRKIRNYERVLASFELADASLTTH